MLQGDKNQKLAESLVKTPSNSKASHKLSEMDLNANKECLDINKIKMGVT